MYIKYAHAKCTQGYAHFFWEPEYGRGDTTLSPHYLKSMDHPNSFNNEPN